MGREIVSPFIMKTFFFLSLLIFSLPLKSQINEKEEYCKKTISVGYYHLFVDIDPSKKFISGKNEILCIITNYSDTLRLGLDANFKITKVLYDDESLKYLRDKNDILIPLHELNEKTLIQTITIYYEGFPKTSVKPPWDGGFIWSEDANGNPFAGVVCELEGAGIWWPAIKDIADKPDSLLFTAIVPEGLYAVSNGVLRSTDTLNNKVCFNWFNPYSIINYNLTVNIGKYFSFNKNILSENRIIALSYYSLENNLSEAKIYFDQIDTVLNIFGHYFGAYPFSEAGYKLVLAPYPGMEHQTAIAFKRGGISIFKLLGFNTNIGYLLVHETAHEWWGNSVSVKSLSDLWINESFATYSESLFIEYLFGKAKAINYINQDLENLIKNEFPIYDSTKTTYNHDIYLKGSAVWNTFRTVVNNDSLWFGFLQSVQDVFKYKSISTHELLNNINVFFKTDYSYFFGQYIFSPQIPELQAKADTNNLSQFQFRWTHCNQDFKMPVIFNSKSEIKIIDATTDWKTFTITNFSIEDFKLLQNDYLIKTKILD